MDNPNLSEFLCCLEDTEVHLDPPPELPMSLQPFYQTRVVDEKRREI